MIGESNTFGELQAERLAAEAICIAGEWVRRCSSSHGSTRTRSVRGFRGLPHSRFKENRRLAAQAGDHASAVRAPEEGSCWPTSGPDRGQTRG